MKVSVLAVAHLQHYWCWDRRLWAQVPLQILQFKIFANTPGRYPFTLTKSQMARFLINVKIKGTSAFTSECKIPHSSPLKNCRGLLADIYLEEICRWLPHYGNILNVHILSKQISWYFASQSCRCMCQEMWIGKKNSHKFRERNWRQPTFIESLEW